MGYTHYWYRTVKIKSYTFSLASMDTAKVCKVLMEKDIVRLGDGLGENKPIFNMDEVLFNGLKKCGHPEEHVGFVWPTEEAAGVAGNYEDVDSGSSWCAGDMVEKRVCGGDCSYEGLVIEREIPREVQQYYTKKPNGLIFQFCKTNYRPYDIAVQCALIIFNHYLGRDFIVRSDGVEKNWDEARAICTALVGYGNAFSLAPEEV